MSFVDVFERRFLFILTRFLALLFIFSLLAVIIIGGIAVSSKVFPKATVEITPAQVMDAMKPSEYAQTLLAETPGSPRQNANTLPGIKMPFVLQKQFNNPDSVRIMGGWLEQIPKEQRQEFIDELTAVVVEAEKSNVDRIQAINKYKELKFAKIQEEEKAKAALDLNRLQYIGAAFACITLIAMFSLILVLLAIERNTHRAGQ